MTTANWNLPPGVTPRMIDEQFGESRHYEDCPAYDEEISDCKCDAISRDRVADAADREYDRRREEELFGI